MTMIILSSGNTLNMNTYMTYTAQPYVQRKSITTENPLCCSPLLLLSCKLVFTTHRQPGDPQKATGKPIKTLNCVHRKNSTNKK